MDLIKRYLPLLTFILGTFGGSVITGVSLGSVALADIERLDKEMNECRQECQEFRIIILEQISNISVQTEVISAKTDVFNELLNQLIKRLGQEHVLPDYPVN